MTTSELWAKAEAEKRWEGTTMPQAAKPFVAADNAGAEWGMLHVLSLLESETAVEAAGMILYGAYDAEHSTRLSAFTDDARAALAAAVAAILAPGDVAHSANTNEETGGGSENG